MTDPIPFYIGHPLNSDMNQVNAVNARMELDLRIGAAFTRFQTLRFQNQFAELAEKILSYGRTIEYDLKY